MELNNLTKITEKTKKRIGRGIGSGKGKTGGRGYKGQKARGKVPAAAVGGGLVLYKKLPFKRGWARRGTQATRSPKPVIIKLEDLNNLKPKSVVNLATLIDNKLVLESQVRRRGVKVLLGRGELKVALSVVVPVSKSAKLKVEQLGGSVG